MNLYRISCVLFFGASILSGCALETPYLDAHFGQATDQAQATQAVNGVRAPTNAQMTARELHNGMSNYMGDRPAPQAIQGVLGSTGSISQ